MRVRIAWRQLCGASLFAVLGVLLASAPANAEPPDHAPDLAPTPAPARAAPAARYALTVLSGKSYTALIEQAIAVSAALGRARQLSVARTDARSELELLFHMSRGEGVITVGSGEREDIDEARALRKSLSGEVAGLTAQLSAVGGAAAVPLADTPAQWMLPAIGEISQPFGPTDIWAEPPKWDKGVWHVHFHDGVDIAATLGAPVRSMAAGVVTFVGHLGDGAEVVFIAHGGGYASLYAHLDDRAGAPTLTAGDVVTAGQVIGHIGMTGLTTGPHLHFQLWRDGVLIDPLGVLR